MKRKADFIMRYVGGERLLVPIGEQVMYLNGIVTLNTTGAFVWELLAEERTADELATAIAARFNVTLKLARTDVQIFVDEITRLGLLEL